MLKNVQTNPSIEEKQRCKGIQRAALKKFKHADYLAQLHRPSENLTINRRIGSKLHQLYTWEAKKRGLCAYDDKRFLLEDGVHSLAFGHRDITARVQNEERPEGRNLVVTAPPQSPNNEDIVARLEGGDPVEFARDAPLTALPDEREQAEEQPSSDFPASKRPTLHLELESPLPPCASSVSTLAHPSPTAHPSPSPSTSCTFASPRTTPSRPYNRSDRSTYTLPPSPEDMHLFTRPNPSPSTSTRPYNRSDRSTYTRPPSPEDMHLFTRPSTSTRPYNRSDRSTYILPPPTLPK